jgi:hypothetical protein
MDIHSNVDLLSLKLNRGAVTALDPEIAGDGRRVELSDGDAVNWTPPPIESHPWDWWGPADVTEPTAMAPVLFGAPPDEQSNESGAAEQLPHHEGEDA